MVRFELGAPVHANNFEGNSRAINANDNVVIWIVAGFWTGPNKMIYDDFRAFVGGSVIGKFRFAAMTVKRSSSPAGDDNIDAKFICGGVLVAFDPMFEKMFVAGEESGRVVFAEDWHVICAKPCGGGFEIGATVRARGIRRMMEEHEEICIARAIE